MVAIAEAGSISAAARRRGGSQPALSRAVARIEARLGVVLLDRTSRSMRLTEAGRAFVEGARRLLRDARTLEATTSAIGGRLGGVLRVSVPPALGRRRLMAPILAWHRAHPAVRLELLLEPRLVDVGEEVDLAVRLGPLPDSELVARRLGSYEHLLVASPGYLAARGTPRDPAELEGHSLVAMSTVGPNTTWPLSRGRLRRVVEVRPCLTTNDGEALVAAVVGGAGITVASDFLIDDAIESGALVRVLPRWSLPSAPITALLTRAAARRPSVRSLLSHLVRAGR
jgi:DNA-binding transcriptional LysR family regulator